MSGSKLRWIVGMAGAVALVAGSVAPAAARGPGGWGSGGWGHNSWGSRGWGGYHRHRDRGLNGGEIIGIAALLGAVAVVASSASKNSKSRSSYPDDREYREDGYYDPAAERDGAYYGQTMSADQAADACAVAVRDKVEGDQGGYAQILDVAEPRAAGQDGWAVDGRVERRSGYRGGGGEVRRFSCDVRGSRVAEVYISRDAG